MYLMVAGGILFTLEVLVLLALLPCAYDADHDDEGWGVIYL